MSCNRVCERYKAKRNHDLPSRYTRHGHNSNLFFDICHTA